MRGDLLDGGQHRRPEVILLVDDDDGVRRLAGAVLQSCGYVVLTACGGREGLELCAEHAGPIDLLLTDVTMPEVGGRELAAGAVHLRPHLQVLFMSGEPWDLSRIAAPGMNAGFLPKPFTSGRLLQLAGERLSAQAIVTPAPQLTGR